LVGAKAETLPARPNRQIVDIFMFAVSNAVCSYYSKRELDLVRCLIYEKSGGVYSVFLLQPQHYYCCSPGNGDVGETDCESQGSVYRLSLLLCTVQYAQYSTVSNSRAQIQMHRKMCDDHVIHARRAQNSAVGADCSNNNNNNNNARASIVYSR
jgi:hypothetical protein